jgi:GNAT superfamily N-acetyltransferase
MVGDGEGEVRSGRVHRTGGRPDVGTTGRVGIVEDQVELLVAEAEPHTVDAQWWSGNRLQPDDVAPEAQRPIEVAHRERHVVDTRPERDTGGGLGHGGASCHMLGSSATVGGTLAFVTDLIRAATPRDNDAIVAIAVEHGFVVDGVVDRDSLADERYRSFVAGNGRLLVVEHEGDVVGAGGVLLDTPTAMVSDLFLLARVQGLGLGGQLLDALLDGCERAATASSQHPAALPVYERRGLVRTGFLQYLRGRFIDDDGPAAAVVEHGPDLWADDRPALAAHWLGRGARSLATGSSRAIVETDGSRATIFRMVGDDAVDSMRSVLRHLGDGTVVTVCVPPWAPTVGWLMAHGFDAFDADVWCTTEPDAINRRLLALHPGLG